MTSTITPIIDETQAAPVLSAEEQKKVVLPDEPWSDTRALDTVRKDFQRMELWRMQNYDKSLRRNAEVYYALTKVKTWEGTNKPRASVPVWMAVRHITTIHSHWMQALFSDDYPFEVKPEPGTSMAQALQVRDLVSSYLNNLNPDVIGMTVREIMSRSVYSALTYGCGPIEIGWMMKESKRQVYSRKALPTTVPMVDPMTGQVVQVSSGQLKWEVARGEQTYTISRPKVQNVLVEDFYFSPNAPSPNPQESPEVAVRQLLPIWYLKEICLPEFGFKLPQHDDDWRQMVYKYKQTMAEVTKSWGEVTRGNYWNPGLEQTSDLANQRIEVVRYWNGHRYVWLLARDFLSFNQPNEFGIKPFVNNGYVPAPGRPYTISVCDLLEGDQKLTQNLIEGRLDEVNLKLHPPVVRKLGAKVSASQRRLRPGVEWEVPDDATRDVAILQMGEVLQSAYVEANMADLRAQQTTGASDIAAMGTASTGGNSANRTATGVQSQNGAFSTRVQGNVEPCEDQVFEPMLDMIFLMAKKYNQPQVDPATGEDVSMIPLDIMNSQVRFKMKASTKLRIRRAAASGALMAVMQTLPAFQAELSKVGKTINTQLVGQLIADSLGIPQNDFMVDMTPQQQQAFQQQMMAPLMAQQQLQDTRMAAMERMKNDSDELNGVVKLFAEILKHPEVIAQLAKEKGENAIMDLLKEKMAPKQLAASSNGNSN